MSAIKNIYSYHSLQNHSIPLYSNRIAAGFPSPANDYIEKKLDLNQHLVHHPEATFFLRVEGDSMINAGIFDNDILVVDRALEPTNNKIIIAALDGDLTVKKIKFHHEQIFLVPENQEYSEIEITPDRDFRVWGVVTYVIHAL